MGSARLQTYCALLFGLALASFFVYVFLYAPAEVPPFKLKILAELCSVLAGLFGVFFTGSLSVVARFLPLFGRVSAQMGGGFALYIMTLLWWSSPASPGEAAPPYE